MPSPERPQALQRQSAKSVVYQTVCDWIITGVMKPGEKILDSELASYFNVSRTPVREALQLLQNQKLVCVIPGRTTVVADLDVEDFEKCYPLTYRDAHFVTIFFFRSISGIFASNDKIGTYSVRQYTPIGNQNCRIRVL